MRARRAGLAGLLALGLLAPAAPARPASEAERRRELEAVRQKIEERRERVAAFERRERGLLETLDDLDRSAAELATATARARERARAARKELEGLEARAADIGKRREATRRAMARRAVALYKAGEAGPVRVLFAAESLQDLLSRSRTLRLLLEHDRHLLEDFNRFTRDLGATRSALAQAAREQEHAARLAQARGQELDAERAARRTLVAETRRDRARERAALVELESAAVALEETLARLRESGSQPGEGTGGEAPFESLRGFLYPPVDAPIVRGFGRVVDEEFRTTTFRKGVDFAAPLGEPVQAVAAGKVRFAGWFRGYGRIVIIDHGGGYFTLCGHLDQVAVEVGETVAAGQRIGTVGETGSLSGPRLYFEIRRGAEPQDPAGWLRVAPTG